MKIEKRILQFTLVLLLASAVTTCAFAAGGNSDGIWWVAIIAAAIGSGGLTAFFTARSIRRRNDAEALDKSTETIGKLLSQVDDLFDAVTLARREARAADGRAAAAEVRAATSDERSARNEEEVRRLRDVVAVVMAAKRIRSAEAFSVLFDNVPIGVVCTTAKGGRFERVNRWVCELLGRTKEEIIHLGWEGIVDPRDMEATRKVEESAHHTDVKHFRNRLLHYDGTPVWVEWDALSYEDDSTVAILKRVDGPGNESGATS